MKFFTITITEIKMAGLVPIHFTDTFVRKTKEEAEELKSYFTNKWMDKHIDEDPDISEYGNTRNVFFGANSLEITINEHDLA